MVYEVLGIDSSGEVTTLESGLDETTAHELAEEWADRLDAQPSAESTWATPDGRTITVREAH